MASEKHSCKKLKTSGSWHEQGLEDLRSISEESSLVPRHIRRETARAV